MSRRTNPLRAVEPATEPPIDVTLAMRADIMERDWSAVHVIADRGPPLMLSDTRKRTWWK